MAMKCKTLMRPKVRFSEQSESTDDSDNCIGPFHGPRIQSIVTLDRPVKLIHGVSEQDLPENRKKTLSEVSTTNDLPKVKVSTRPLPTTVVSAPCLTEKNSGGGILFKSSSKNHQKNCPTKSQIKSTKSCKQISIKSSTVPSKNSGTVKRELNTKNYIECNKENVSQRSSQFKERSVKVGSKLSSTDKAEVVARNKSASGQNLKSQPPDKSSITSQLKASNLVATKDLLSRVKLPVAATKPKAKLGSTLRSKSQVRSEMAKNISGSKPNVYVGPGMPRARTQSLSSVSQNINSRTESNSGHTLDRPEYNSILSTIKKLREVKRGKIVTDIDNLPTNYKHLCLKKMSSALDFPPGESIFHDLIDLSITEKQLPSRLIRSRDPEPRQKDLEPILSDFFVPQYGSEYAEAVKIRPRSPQIVDTLSEFKISDRIRCWKTCLNEI